MSVSVCLSLFTTHGGVQAISNKMSKSDSLVLLSAIDIDKTCRFDEDQQHECSKRALLTTVSSKQLELSIKKQSIGYLEI